MCLIVMRIVRSLQAAPTRSGKSWDIGSYAGTPYLRQAWTGVAYR